MLKARGDKRVAISSIHPRVLKSRFRRSGCFGRPVFLITYLESTRAAIRHPLHASYKQFIFNTLLTHCSFMSCSQVYRLHVEAQPRYEMHSRFCTSDSDFIGLFEQTHGKSGIELPLPKRPATNPSAPLCIFNYCCLIGEPGRLLCGPLGLCFDQSLAVMLAVED
jgi:hypothetical protein